MRVLTTWMYFDRSEIRAEAAFHRRPRGRGEEPEPGIGVAWFAGDTTALRPFSDLDYFNALRGDEGGALSEELLRNCTDLFLLDAEEFEFTHPERLMKNPQLSSTS
jgi:hypothetical protein